MTYQIKNKRVWVAGHQGMVGSAIVHRLGNEDCEILTIGKKELDLRKPDAVTNWMKKNTPEIVFIAAAKVGGIYANSHYPVDFLYDNLMIATNIIHAALETEVEKLLFLGSSCIYPRNAKQPITEDALLTGELEPTNEWYAIAKIAGIKLCQAYRQQYGADFISAMPTNLFGPGDNFHPKNAHVPAALLSRFDDAKLQHKKQTIVWGSGRPKRQFLYVDDLADAAVYLMKHYSDYPHINVGSDLELSIKEFAYKIKQCVAYQGELVFDTTKPDGMPRKALDVSKLTKLGWTARFNLDDALKDYYAWFNENRNSIRK